MKKDLLILENCRTLIFEFAELKFYIHTYMNLIFRGKTKPVFQCSVASSLKKSEYFFIKIVYESYLRHEWIWIMICI